MSRVIPRYVPSNSIEDRFGFMVTGQTSDGQRVYLSRSGDWSGVQDAEFFPEPLYAADGLKEVREEERLAADGIIPDSVTLVRVVAILIPTEISEDDLRRKRREAALAKLTPDELEALGLDASGAVDKTNRRRRA